MDCSQAEQLFDTYLEGSLRGSLRLEFDAHRVRCAQCQQTLAMLETIGSVVAGEDPELPELSSDFSDRVLTQVQRPRTVKFPRWKAIVVGAAVAQAAAAITLAMLWSSAPQTPADPDAPTAAHATAVAERPDRSAAGDRALTREIYERIFQQLDAKGVTLTEDMRNLARYANFELPPDVAESSMQLADRSPLDVFFNGVLFPAGKPADTEAEDAGDGEDVHSI